MQSESNVVSFAEICSKIGSGATPRGGKDVYTDSGVALIRSQNVHNNRFTSEGLAFIGQKHARLLDNVEVQPGDVLLNITGDSVARACQVDPKILPARVNQHVAIVRADPAKADNRFIRYFLTSNRMQGYMLQLAFAGATRKALTKGMIESFELPALPVDEQRRVGSVLGTFDDKIELNRRMNRTLEELARAIFKAWFVDFEPVKAKADGATSFPGMPQDVFDQLPDTFVTSDLGPIPEGWEVGTVGDIASLSRDSITPADHPDEEFEHFSLPAYDDGAMPAVDRGDTIKSNKYQIPDGCVLVSKLNPKFPRIWMPFPSRAGRRQIASTEFLVSSPRSGWSREYLYALFTSEGFISEMIQTASGTSTSHQRVRPKEFEQLEIVLPAPRIREAYQRLVEPMFARISSNLFESQTLAETRDTVLPKLISGELRVPTLNEPEDIPA